MRVFLYTTLALLAFAGNSVLCRLALGESAIDAASFTAIRLLSGIIVLVLVIAVAHRETGTRPKTASKGSWKASFVLFLYAIAFSYAYVSLDTGVGALILFGTVQITMISVGLFSGNRFHYLEWLGVIVAFSGFVYMVMPGIAAPPLTGFILMSLAGVAWGLYSLAGKGSVNPLHDTAYNFLRTLPFLTILILVTVQNASISQKGILLAITSGAVTSGAGYTIWYRALRGLSNIQAAVVQLLVPVIAAIGGVIFAGELISFRLAISSVIIIGGILAVILAKHFNQKTIQKSTE